MNKSFFKTILFSLTVILFASCDKDFNEIGTGIIGEDHFVGTYTSEVNVVAYNNSFGAVQSNNLPINALGIYTNPFFGKTKASVVTQVELKTQNPTVKPNPEISNVELSIPYFSTADSLDSDGNRTYELDSIFGRGKIKLEVRESAYFLRDLDPATGFQQAQPYYSDFNMSGHEGVILNDSTAAPEQNANFYFDDTEIVTYKQDEDGNNVIDKRSKPAMTLALNKDFFAAKLLAPSASANLITNNAFKQYFRGLYFKVDHSESFPAQESLALINFAAGTITVKYTAETERVLANGEPARDEDGNLERGPYSMVLNLTGNTVNILETTDSPSYIAGTATPNQTVGDPKLYLKGGAGSSAIIELFGPDTDGNGTADQLEYIRSQNWNVNNAALTFYIDQSSMNGSSGNVPDPNRIFLYDVDNRVPLADHSLDGSTSRFPKYSKYVHDGLVDTIHVDVAGQPIFKYRIRITNHIRRLLDSDDPADNVKLGLVVTEAIAETRFGKRKNQQPVPVATDWVPMASVINPLGTVLYGTDSSIPENVRLKLEIYYTTYN